MTRCFLYLRVCDDMLMVHDPKIIVYGTPDDNYFEFDDNLISDAINRKTFPQHVGEYIRLHIYRRASPKLLRAFDKGDGYEEACVAIRNAYDVYKKLDFGERTKLHKATLARLEHELRREQDWALSHTFQ